MIITYCFIQRTRHLQKPVQIFYHVNKSKLELAQIGGSCIKRFNNTQTQNNLKATQDKKWTSLKGILTSFVPVGVCLMAVMQWRAYRRLTDDKDTPKARQWQVQLYCSLPLRLASRCWGWLADKTVPITLRPYVYGLYSSMFGVNLDEAITTDLKQYPTLADFFARELKKGARTIDKDSCLVSPCDGTLLHCGSSESGTVEQVKGVTYSLKSFIGENTWRDDCDKSDYYCSLLHKTHEKNRLYQCIIYLAPGDYHRFHSPADWQATYRKHFSGQLLSVSPGIANWLPGLFTLNERAVYIGHWLYGFFSFSAVGATNVGKIKVYGDDDLSTNHSMKRSCQEKSLGSTIVLEKGCPFGEFRMGSTIVLVFEAPPNFKFCIKPGEKVRMGQRLGKIKTQNYADRVVYDENENIKSR